MRALLRLTGPNPALTKVWAEICSAGGTGTRRGAGGAYQGGDEASVDITPALRFAAALASASVRVAVESWAAGNESAAGPNGPACLAVRNLEALRDFVWEIG